MTRRTLALCAEGTRAEFERRLDDARRLYAEAWNAATDDYDRTVAAHYVARLKPQPHERLRWNLTALRHAQQADPAAVVSFLGSLYVNLGESYEATGDRDRAKKYYALAAEHGVVHRPTPPGSPRGSPR